MNALHRLAENDIIIRGHNSKDHEDGMAVLGNYEMTAITTNSEEDGGRSQPLASEDTKINDIG